MRVNQSGVELIKSFEGILDGNPDTVNLEPYICPSGFWTVGWGHVLTAENGEMMSSKKYTKEQAYKVYPDGLSLEQAEQLLLHDIQKVCDELDPLLEVELNENQYSALVSLVFNIGIANFKKSNTLLAYINSREFNKAADKFLEFNKAGGKVLPGLVRRRKSERMLFVRPVNVIYEPLTKSRTVAGAVATGTIGAIEVIKEASGYIKQIDKDVAQYLSIGMGLLVVIFAIYIFWARYTDKKRGYK